jgi:hypothetical protein
VLSARTMSIAPVFIRPWHWMVVRRLFSGPGPGTDLKQTGNMKSVTTRQAEGLSGRRGLKGTGNHAGATGSDDGGSEHWVAISPDHDAEPVRPAVADTGATASGVAPSDRGPQPAKCTAAR